MAISDNLKIENYYDKVEVEGNTEISLLNSPPTEYEFKTVNSVFRVTQKYVARPDLIALDTLGDPNLDWIILFANDIDDPFNDINVGDVLEIPTPQEVFSFLERFRRE